MLNAPRGWLEKLRYATGLPLELLTSGTSTNKDIVLSDSPDQSFNDLAGATTFVLKNEDETKTVSKDISHNVANEGYQYKVGATGVVLKFKRVGGALRAIQSVTQILMQDGRPVGHHRILPNGEGIDYPKYESRRIMLDVARKFISVEQIVGYMEKMSQHRLNELHMHINDDARPAGSSQTNGYFRLDVGDSTRQRKLTPDGQFYTREDWDRLERAGKRYGIKIIPEFDSPGHALAFIQDDGTLSHWLASAQINKGRLRTHTASVRKKTANYIADLVMKFRDWFQGDTLHIGGDESGNIWADDIKYLNLLYSKLKKSETIPNGFEHIEIWEDSDHDDDDARKFPMSGLNSDVDLVNWIGGDFSENVSRKSSSRFIDMLSDLFYFVPRLHGLQRTSIKPSDVYGFSAQFYTVNVDRYLEYKIISDGLGLANWNDVTLNESLDVNYINAGMSQNFAMLGLVSWYGPIIKDGSDNVIPYADLGYDNLLPVSHELLSYWVRDHFPYLNAKQSKDLLLNTARHQKIKLIDQPNPRFHDWRHKDILEDGSASEDWMAWDTDDMSKAFQGPTKFSEGWFIVDMPGEVIEMHSDRFAGTFLFLLKSETLRLVMGTFGRMISLVWGGYTKKEKAAWN